jgi:hypothetical protein
MCYQSMARAADFGVNLHMTIDEFLWPEDRVEHIARHGVMPHEVERPMKKSKLPKKTDSVQKLAEFWDTHDLTDFEDQLEEVAESVFVRGNAIKVPLESRDVKAVEQLAQAKGVSREELIRAWVLQKLAPRKTARRTKR